MEENINKIIEANHEACKLHQNMEDINKIIEAIHEACKPDTNPAAVINLVKMHWVRDRQKFEEIINAKNKIIDSLWLKLPVLP